MTLLGSLPARTTDPPTKGTSGVPSTHRGPSFLSGLKLTSLLGLKCQLKSMVLVAQPKLPRLNQDGGVWPGVCLWLEFED